MVRKAIILVLFLGMSFDSAWLQKTDPSDLCQGLEINSFVPDPENCNRFFQCNGDSFIQGTCPTGMFYHAEDVCSFDTSGCASPTGQPTATTSTPTAEMTMTGVSSTQNSASTTSATTTELSSTQSEASTPSTTNDPDQLCANADPDLPHFIKSPTHCAEYYICVDRKAIRQTCQQGKYWNAEELYCDEPINVLCPQDRIPNPEEFCGATPQSEISFTASPIDCGDYYICVKQKPFLMRCAPENHWNDVTKQCDDPRVAGCKVANTSLDLNALCSYSQEAFIAHPNYCNLYIYCINGKASTQICPFLTDWDTKAKRCLARQQTKCTKPRLN